jgi:hypothetical protein
MEPMLGRATELLHAGQIGPDLETALDALDEMVLQFEGVGLYAPVVRGYQPLPGGAGQPGAQWWTCPRGQVSSHRRASGSG